MVRPAGAVESPRGVVMLAYGSRRGLQAEVRCRALRLGSSTANQAAWVMSGQLLLELFDVFTEVTTLLAPEGLHGAPRTERGQAAFCP